MGFQAILGLQFRGWKAAVRCTAGTALHSSPVSVAVLRQRIGTAGSGQPRAGPCAAAATWCTCIHTKLN